MKGGLAAFESERLAAASPARLGFMDVLWSCLRNGTSFALPRMPGVKSLLAVAGLLVLAATAVTWRMHLSPVAMAPVATIKLLALRGGEGDVAHAPTGRPLELVFGRTDLAADLSYRAEVVNASGRQMWGGDVRVTDPSLSIRVDQLRAGRYWVRLYSSSGQLLREFGLSVG